MKNWEWINEGTEEPKTYNEQVVEEYTDQLLDLVNHYAEPGDVCGEKGGQNGKRTSK